MSYSNFRKVFKQLKAKPGKLKKYKKHNSPKKRTCGIARLRCKHCGRIRGHVSKYGLHLCRQCFRDTAVHLGFKKYN